MTKVILISGYKRSGKDFVAKLLAEKLYAKGFTVDIQSFATPLKQVVASTFDITLEQLEDYKNAEDDVLCHIDNAKIHHNLHTISMRKILQRFGTEAAKSVFGVNVWGMHMKDRIEQSTANYIIIPDYRFDQEYCYLSHFDFEYPVTFQTLQIVNDNIVPEDAHSSESLPTRASDYVINNTAQDATVVEKVVQYVSLLMEGN